MAVNSTETAIYYGANTSLKSFALPQTIRTVAGSTAGYSNAQGTAALFSNPQSIVSNRSTLIVSDTGNSQTRSIDSNSNVTDVKFYEISNGITQSLSLYSNSIYSVLNVGSNSAIVQIPITYPSTTFTFSNTSNTLIQNATGRPVTIAVAGGTVTNSNLNSVAGISDVKTLYNTSGTTYTLY
jgi:hypothetical protein